MVKIKKRNIILIIIVVLYLIINSIMKNGFTLLLILFFFFATQVILAQEYTSNKIFGKQQLAIREVRRNAVTGNLGWNGLTGVGITYHNYFNKQMGVDLGVGLALTGFKFGGRFRYLFMEKNFSPFIAAGFMYGMGFGESALEYKDDYNTYTYTVNASPFAQIALGIEHLSNKGFLFSFNLGYAILMKETNYKIISGNPSSDNLRSMDMMFGSGIVIEFSIGYAFGGK